MSELQYKNKVVIVTGAGGGLGKAYSVFFASRGANILVNDLSRENADKAVKEINDAGKGQAVANYNSATEGNVIVKQAVDKWGRVDILINKLSFLISSSKLCCHPHPMGLILGISFSSYSAGILRDKSFASMTDKEWDIIHDVHVRGAYACTKAAWPLMRKQKYGRIIMASHLDQSSLLSLADTASAAGIYGNFGQANYSSAKLALVAFAKTLAREGAKYNIHANAIAPVAASQMTETVMPPEMLANLSPEMIVPLVAYLCHDQTEDNGKLFEAGAGWYGRVRWERSKGVVFKTDDTFTPAAVKAKWEQINDFSSGSTFPENITDANYLEYLEEAKSIKKNETDGEVRFDGKTILVTGAGAGLGRAYALMFAKLGGSVVVNDMNKEAADSVVKECEKLGGKALAVVCSAEEGEKLVNAAVEKFGSLHVVVCNAGILRDKSFAALTDEEWDLVYKVHVRGTYSVCKAAWPIFRKQKYGRIVNTSSSVGVHGNFGQANYSTAKSAILGLTKTLAIEGKKYGIIANTLVPNAGTNMTRTIWPEEMVQAFSPAFIAPVVGYLTSEANESTLGLYEVSGGWCAAYRWQRSYGYAFPINTKVTVEKLKAKWDVVNKFDNQATNPNSAAESLESIIDNFSNESESSSNESGDDDYSDPEDPEIVKKAKETAKETGEYTFTERDVALYNLGIGATEKEVEFTFEGDSDFRPIPTFGVIPQFATSSGLPMDWLPNFSPMMLLHGEQYLQIKGKIPTSGTLTSEARLSEVLDKGKAAAVTSVTTTKDSEGNVIFENQSTVFIRGAGGFGGKKTGENRGAATAANKPPSRKPDHVEEEKTLPIQAALYRLSGDYNPLHIDPDFAKVGGFDQPILHGLCFFGISGKHIYKKFGEFKDIKVRFVGSVYPGETVVTEMWKESDKVIFQTKCKERDTVVLGAAAVTLA